jgi:hypothetical protein
LSLDQERLILVVTGAHLRAEAEDRPIAYRLRQGMLNWLADAGSRVEAERVLVCSDLWYLNQAELRRRPTVSVGPPGVNALTAYLGGKLPTAFAVRDRVTVQFDAESADAVAACWGLDGGCTGQAVEAFVGRYLDLFMGSAMAGWEGKEDETPPPPPG